LGIVDVLLITLLAIAAVGLLIVGFVAYPYRGRGIPSALPQSDRIDEALAAVTEKVDPGPSPVHGVLSTPEKSRRMSRRFEKAERAIRHPIRLLTDSRS
jgi:hypothetical protein